MTWTNRKPRGPRNPEDALRHGNMYQYESRGCRCDECRVAKNAYRRERDKALRSGQGDYIVSAELCRKHLLWLRSQGVGKKAITEASGIDEPRIRKIRAGIIKRVRSSTEQRIMRVDTSVRFDGSLVPAGPTLRRLGKMRAMGLTYEHIARMLGFQNETVQFSKAKRVTAKTELRVEKLFNRLMRGELKAKPSLSAIVPATRTWDLVTELESMGYTKAEVWRMLGNEGTTLRIGKRGVRLHTARAVEELYYAVVNGERRVA